MTDWAELSDWFDAHCAPLVLYARQWLDGAAAEDVVQEVYVRLMLQRMKPANVKAWLYKSVRNGAISHARSRSRRENREQATFRGKAPWFEAGGEDWLDAEAAREALQSLPPAQREAIVLRIWSDLTLKEIAQVTGSSVSTVFDQYRAGLRALRERMGVSCPTNNH
jgi:RNA polymerase sigma factor (sigma-70 family)